MAGWHHRLDGRESEWTPGVGDGQGGLACCDSWGSQRAGHDWETELNWIASNTVFMLCVNVHAICSNHNILLYFLITKYWKDYCWSWNSNTLATSCEELTHWKRPWCWEGLGAGREGDDRGWDGWMASLTRWTWVWVNSRSWWWTGRPGVLQFMGSQRVGHYWVSELNWTEILTYDS